MPCPGARLPTSDCWARWLGAGSLTWQAREGCFRRPAEGGGFSSSLFLARETEGLNPWTHVEVAGPKLGRNPKGAVCYRSTEKQGRAGKTSFSLHLHCPLNLEAQFYVHEKMRVRRWEILSGLLQRSDRRNISRGDGTGEGFGLFYLKVHAFIVGFLFTNQLS